MEETRDMVAELESLVAGEGVETDQPSGGSEPTIEFQGKQYTPTEAQKMMDEWKASYTRTRQAEKNELRELRQQVNMLAEMQGNTLPRSAVEEVTRNVLKGIQGGDELPADEYLTGKHRKILEDSVRSQIEPGVQMTQKEVQALQTQVKNLSGQLVKMQMEGEINSAISKYPDADRDEVLVKAILAMDRGNQPDIRELVKESHQRRSPESFDLSRLNEKQQLEVAKKIIEREQAKRKAEQPISPDAGGPPPAVKDEEYWKLVKEGSFEDLAKWASKNIK